MLEHAALTEQIIGAVHRTLGPGFVEAIYEEALAVELELAGVPFKRQVTIALRYRGRPIGVHRLDLFVADEIVVELKAVKAIEPLHFMIVRSYLRTVGRKHALLLNFSSAPLEVRRVLST